MAQVPAVDIHAVSKLTNLNDINRMLHEVLAKERVIDTELDKHLARREELEKQILQLHASTSEVIMFIAA